MLRSLLLFAFLDSSADFPPERYPTHSFRRRAATTAALKAPVSTLKAMGCWSFATYERYLHPEAILDAQKAMCH